MAHPGTQIRMGSSGALILHQRGEYHPLQFLEDRRFPKECRDGDKTVLAQRVGFVAVLLEIPAVVFQRFESAEGHAPLDAPRQGAVLVVREVHAGGAAHQPEYPGQFGILRRLSRLRRFDRDLRIAREGYQLQRDSGRRKDIIHHTRGDGASRHAVELRGSHILSEGDTARGFDRLEAQRPIGCGSRQNHAEGLAAAVCRQVAEKRVDRHVAATRRPGRGVKNAIGNTQIASRRNHVNMIGLNASLAFHFRDGHFAFLGKQFRQMALVLRIEVLNQHERHAGIVRQVAEELRECLQSASGGAYTDDGGATVSMHSSAASRTIPAGFCANRAIIFHWSERLSTCSANFMRLCADA